MPSESFKKDPLSQMLTMAAAAALAGGFLFALAGQEAWALGWGAGAVWNGINLTLLKRLSIQLFENRKGQPLPAGVHPKSVRRRLVFLLLAKFAVLYPAGGAALLSGRCSPAGFAAGFTAVLVMAAAGVVRASTIRPAH